jgi:protein-S-isoprenylcysteine O-methyltransferase Ste14
VSRSGASLGDRLPSLGARGEGWFALQVALLAAVGAGGAMFRGQLASGLQGAFVLVGGLLIVAGVALGFAGIRALDISLSPLPRPSANGQLVVHGLYGVVRHPIYVGLLLASVGWSTLWASVAAGVATVLLAILLDLKSRREEAWLRERYPGYADYAARTRRFIPGIY